MQNKKLTEVDTTPFAGGMDTYHEPALLPAGSFSLVQNMRAMHPGFKQRPGYIKAHYTADSTNSCLSMYQFTKGKLTERHFYAQMSDGDILEATVQPPTSVELMTLDVAPATTWLAGATITGATSHATCTIVCNVSSLTYYVKDRIGNYTLGEILSDGTTPTDQGGANPTLSTATFGSEVFSGNASPLAASWATLDDLCIFSSGVDQHQICAGTTSPIWKFIVYDSNTMLPDLPAVGIDYTADLNSSAKTNNAILDSLGNFVSTTGTVVCTSAGTDFQGTSTKFLTELTVGQPVYVDANEKNIIVTITSDTVATVVNAWGSAHDTKSYTTSNDCVLICTPVMPNKLTFTVALPNGTASVAHVSYWTTTGWKVLTVTDGTISSGKTMAISGDMTWTQTTDHCEKFMYGENGFWIKIAFSVALDSETEISACTFGSTFIAVQDMWDGGLVDAIEAQVYSASAATYARAKGAMLGSISMGSSTMLGGGGSSVGGSMTTASKSNKSASAKNKYSVFGSTSVDVGALTSSDKVYFSSPDPIVGFYADCAATPNLTATTAISGVYYLNSAGSGVSVGTIADGSSGLSKSGYITFKRQSAITPVQFNNTGYLAYWYYFTVDKTLSDEAALGIQVMPYYDINNYGYGICNGVWNGRMIYVFDKDPSYVYIVDPANIQSVSSSNTAVYEAGDGRNNKVVCIKPFYNELMLFQEEKGSGGGCITLIQGTTIENMGKIHLSNYYGTMNAHTVELIETSAGGHYVYFLSKRGIMYTDGKSVAFVKNFDKVRNYFDPTDSECIVPGYESKMYLKYDSLHNCLKIGLTTGTGTNNNVFLVYDLLTNEFMLDTYANNFQCEYECDAVRGTSPIVRLAGGQGDGFIYMLNSGLNDVLTAISGAVILELNKTGRIIRNSDMIIRAKSQSAGSMTITPYYNGVQQSNTKARVLTAENTSEVVRRHRIPLNFVEQNISVKFTHSAVNQGWYLLDYGVELGEYSNQ
jgi:hypothetical protein